MPAHLTGKIPALRSEIEFRDLRDGRVEIRDPSLLQVLMVDGDDFRVAKVFDGRRNATEIARDLRTSGRSITQKRVETVAADFDELLLLDSPRARKAEPQRENVSPWTQLDARRGLTVLPEADPNARWSCHGCGACCHGLTVELSKEEEARIDIKLYRDLLGDEHFAEDAFLEPDQPRKRVLRQISDRKEACIFLTLDGRCLVHARQGMEFKPNACQLFPYTVVSVPRSAPRLGVRVNCQSMYKSFLDGEPLQKHAEHVFRILSDATVPAGTDIHRAPSEVDVFGRKGPLKRFEKRQEDVVAALEKHGLLEGILRADEKVLRGLVAGSRRRYGAKMLEHIAKESEGPAPIETGGYTDMIKRLRHGRRALERLAAGTWPAPVRSEVEAFLIQQIRHTFFVYGPLAAPDGGYGLVALMLGVLAAMHAIGPRGDLAVANTAYDVYSAPLLETAEHLWPILYAIDPKYTRRLKKDMAP